MEIEKAKKLIPDEINQITLKMVKLPRAGSSPNKKIFF